MDELVAMERLIYEAQMNTLIIAGQIINLFCVITIIRMSIKDNFPYREVGEQIMKYIKSMAST